MRLLTIAETAERLRLSASTIRTLCDQGTLKAVRPTGKVNGARRVLEDSLNAYIKTLLGDKPEATEFPEDNFDDSEREVIALANQLRKVR